MGFDERIQRLRERIEAELRDVFGDTKTQSLWAPMAHPVMAGGKRVRPLLMILSCRAVGGDVEDCIDAAVAVELVHTFTLVHDDIMDHDDLRRGQPTVHKKWDEATAILAGDGLVTLAYRTFLKSQHPGTVEAMRVLTDGLLDLCEGQALDKAFEERDDVSLGAYEDMIEKKTATLLRVSAEVGCILGGGSESERDSLNRYAENLGKAFQIQDDMLDLLSDEMVTGKPRGSDLLERKKTYLSLHFLTNADEASRNRFLKMWRSGTMSGEDVAACHELFQASGTFDAAQQAVSGLMASAVSELEALSSSEAREDLIHIAGLIQKRIA